MRPGIEECVWRWSTCRPGAIALSDRAVRISYAELARRADVVAARLQRAGVGPEVLVALSADRGVDLVVGVLGILRAGGAYVPIDPSYPAARRDFLMRDAACEVVVTQSRHREAFAAHGGSLLVLDDPAADRIIERAPPHDDPSDRLAYIIYTSGSTGKPKGVQITQGNVQRLMTQVQPWYGFNTEDVWSMFHSISFDVSVFEMWGAFCNGGRLVIVPHEVTRDAIAFRALVRDEGVTVLSQTPSAFRMFLRADALLQPPAADALRYVIFAGEALDLRVLKPWFDRHGDARPRMVNMYGTTETTVHASYRIVTRRDADEPRSLIGVPIPDLSLHVLDAAGAPVADGQEGEIWIGGAGVARGYFRRPDLNAERFVQRHGTVAGRMYRTGDLARRCADGELEYVGRIDHQVKVRGFRIELGEIETVLRGLPGVSDAVVLLRRDVPGEPCLVGYLVRSPGQSLQLESAWERLRRELPEYMCPAALLPLDALPLTDHGKLDRAALPPPPGAAKAPAAAGLAGTAGLVAALFGEVLGLTAVDGEADFFALGGTSLQAMELALRIAEECGVVLPPGAVFRAATVPALVAEVDKARSVAPRTLSDEPAPQGWFPLSPSQQQFWIVQQLHPGSTAFHCPAAFRLRGELDRGRLAAVLERACRRHTALRTVFGSVEGRPAQRIEEEPTFHLQLREGEGWDAAAAADAVAREPLDLSRSAGAAVIIRLAAQDHLFVIVLHHVVTDGWSLRELLEEMAADYAGCARPTASAQFYQFEAEQRRRLDAGELGGSEAYWTGNLADVPATTEIPTEFVRPAAPTFRAERLEFDIPTQLASGIQAFAQRERCTMNSVILGALAALVHRYSGQRDLVLGVPYAGRDLPGSAQTQGLFMNLLPLRLRLPVGTGFRDLTRQSHSCSQAAYAHNAWPFARLVQALSLQREMNRQPLVQLAFAPQTSVRLELPGLQSEALYAHPGESYYDLCLCLWQRDDGLHALFVYSAELFSAPAMHQLRDHLLRLLEAAVADPDRPLEQLDYLGSEERQRLLFDWSGAPRMPAPSALPDFLEVFEGVVKAQPHAPAIRRGEETLSYAELDAWSNRIAHGLRDRDIGNDSIVAIASERSPEAFAAILGVWKAGAAYLPLDPSYPAERLRWMLADSKARVLLATEQALPALGTVDIDFLALDRATRFPETGLLQSATGAALAYLIYTSGSTGQPKGVMIERSGLAFLTAALLELYPLPAGARVLSYAPLSFDASVADLAGCFSQGAEMVIPPQGQLLAGIELAEFLERERIAQVLLPTSVLAQLPPRPLPELQRLVSGGERCPATLVERWSAGREFINAYGPTEASVGACIHRCVPGEGDPPIGRAVPGALLYVLDENGNLVPPLVPGELYIGGRGLARGYLGRERLTAERFVDGVAVAPGRLYRSGDRVRWRRDGVLEFIDRFDQQRKLRGFRIELGEIEAALRGDPDVQAAAATIKGEGASARLLAYVVPAAGRNPCPADILERLRARLPAQLIPAELVLLPNLPLTPNGKLDVARLPGADATSAAGRAGKDNAVTEAWRGVLGREVSPQVNFFDAGGTSLLLVELQSRLEVVFGRRIALAELFAHPSIAAMRTLLGAQAMPVQQAATPRPAIRGGFGEGIAIVGMAARFPGAPDLDAYWRNLCEGVESISRFHPAELAAAGVPDTLARDPAYVPARGVIEGDDTFDAALFGMAAHEAERVDPQQRVWLECALAALEDAGCDPRRHPGAVGIYAGVGAQEYLLRLAAAGALAEGLDYQLGIGNDKDFVATRSAYKLGLRGPALTVQSACSTSLVAVATACRALLAGECDVAVAGAASLSVPSRVGYLYREGMILSPDGHCRPFDRAARGTVPADGAGAVVLKRLADAQADGDDIYAVVVGAAVNNDGDDKVGYTAPGAAGQRAVIRAALAAAGLSAFEVGYVEAHGTGTALGDPIEFAALRQVFEEAGAAPGSCALGAVKGNIGHTNAAAGVAGLIKAALAIRHRRIPGTLHFTFPNPELNLESSPFFVTAATRDWHAAAPRAAAVSSFGIGGTNAHVVLREASRARQDTGVGIPCLLPLSAATPTALAQQAAALGCHLDLMPQPLPAVARTLQSGRSERAVRAAVVATDAVQAAHRLSEVARSGQARVVSGQIKSAFVFPGQGAQSSAMGLQLARAEPQVLEELQRVDVVLQAEAGLSLLQTLESGAALDQTALAQPLLFGLEYALASVLVRWGLAPAAMLGHSLGEYVAACLAGVMSLPQAVHLVAERGRLMQDTAPGVMLSVPLPEGQLLPLLGDLDLAAVNGAALCVASGDEADVARLERALAERGLEGRRLRTTRAFHSRALEPMLPAFRRALGKVRWAVPATPYLSCLSGDWIQAGEATDPEYWLRQLRRPVRFHDALGRLLRHCQVALEVGPGDTLGALARRHSECTEEFLVLPTLGRSGGNEAERWLESLGAAWCAGAALDWDAMRGAASVGLAHLPVYPFERRRYWLLPDPGRPAETAPSEDESTWLYAPSWNELPAVAPGNAPRRWLVCADRGGLGARLARELGSDTVLVHAGDGFARRGPCQFTVDPARREDFRALFDALAGQPAEGIVHAFSLDAATSLAGLDEGLALGYFSVAALVAELERPELGSVQLSVLSAGGQAAGAAPANPLAASLAGLMRVVAEEYPRLRSRHIDLPGVVTAEVTAPLLRELKSDFSTRLLCLREGRRLGCTFSLAPAPQAATPRLREGGVYLITGGLGGMGLALAAHLARHYRAQLVLASRTPLPCENDWPRLSHEEPELGARLELYRSLRSAAGGLRLVQADVADPAQAHALVQAAMQDFGHIDGVIHAAGVTGGGALQRRGEDTARAILRAKLHGTLALEAALAGVPHDFLFLCSSLTALKGVFGQADYTAANAFLDAYAQHADRPGRRVVALNWDGWDEVGSYARHHARTTGPAAAMQPAPAGALLDAWDEVTPGGAYRTVLEAQRWVMAEHRVQGEPMLPGSAYLELACEVARARGWSYPFSVRELTLLSPCTAPDGTAPVLYTAVRESGDGLELRIESEHDGRRRPHALARLAPGGPPAAVESDLLTAATSAAPAAALPRRGLIEFGPRWNCLRWRRGEEGTHFGACALPPAYAEEAHAFVLHPALLDTLTAVVAEHSDSDAWLPFSYSGVTVYGPLGAEVLVAARESRGPGARHLSLCAGGADGVPLLRIEDYMLRGQVPAGAH
ncbi:MAG TPA: amino acid adenylation domain-containing protein [Nevskia sp.]|nr:amino acid adenylation domain-containing protein [Nevskia sp.]